MKNRLFSFKELLDVNLAPDYFVEKIFSAKYKGVFLVGPYIRDKKDLDIFKRRILSSSFSDLEKYKSVILKDIDFYISNNNTSCLINKMVEIDRNRRILVCNIIDIPFYE